MSETGTAGLRAGLRRRHMTMLAIGGAVGAGLFVGSGAVINAAGPAAVVSYAVAGLLVVMTGVNLVSVRSFGEFEFWFASIKVAAIVVFLALGVLYVLGLWPDAPGGFGTLTAHGMPVPNGVASIFSAIYASSRMLYVLTRDGGSQLRLRARLERDDPDSLTYRMWAHPYLTWLVIVVLLVVLGSMLFMPERRPQLYSSVAGLVIISALYPLRRRYGRIPPSQAPPLARE